MKKIFLFLLLAAGTVSAQKTEIEVSEKNIVGKWVFSDLILPGPEKTDTFSAKERKELLEGMALDFREDHTCMTSSIMDLDGKWALDIPAKKIKVTDRKTNTWTIHSLTAAKITMSRNDSGDKQQLVFKKQ